MVKNGGFLIIELPTANVFMQLPEVTNFVGRRSLKSAGFDSCCVGLKENDGTYIKRPRRILNNLTYFFDNVNGKRCGGGRSHVAPDTLSSARPKGLALAAGRINL